MNATVALLTALAMATTADAPAPSPVWVVAEPAAAATIARVTSELRAVGCEVRVAPLDGPPDAVAERLLEDDAPGAPELVVIVHASPAPVEIWWWTEDAARPEHDLVQFATTSEETRVDAIRVAEAVRARIALPITISPAPPPAIVVAAPAPAGPGLVLRLAVGPTLSGHVEAESAAGLALSVAVPLSRHTAAVLNLSLPLAAVDWDEWNGRASTRDYVAAALFEGRLTLPVGFEVRGAAGVSFHTRVSHGLAPYAPSVSASTTDFTLGPALAAAIAYRIDDSFGLVAAAAADATYPNRDIYVDDFAVAFPGRLLWSLGLLGEVEF
jgi:hypothetical protein